MIDLGEPSEVHGTLYVYVHNEPTLGSDPTGLNPIVCSATWASAYAACMFFSGGDHHACVLVADAAESACLAAEAKACPD